MGLSSSFSVVPFC